MKEKGKAKATATMKYIHRLEFQDPENCDVATATTIEEIEHLAKAGFKKFD